MSEHAKTIINILLIVILLMSFTSPAMAQTDTNPSQTQIIRTTSNSITFKVNFPVNQLAIQESQFENRTYTTVTLPGYSTESEPGAPQLPLQTEVLGVPFDSEISISVTPGEEKTQKINAPVLPVASESVERGVEQSVSDDWSDLITTKVLAASPDYYEGNKKFPGSYYEITNNAVMRSQRLVSIALFPVQYDPGKNELVVVDSLTVTLEFTNSSLASQGSNRIESDVYEQFFQDNLLNYEQAKAWRKDPSSQSTLTQTPWSPPDPGWRIKIRETGIYYLTFTEMETAGIPINSIDPDTIKMFYLGEEIAINLVDGEGIYFYGEGIDSKYTRDNVYWLTYGGDPGLRMQTIDGTPTEAPVPASYLTREHFEQDQNYRSEAEGPDELDHFFWNYVYRADTTVDPKFTYNLNLDKRYEGELTITLFLIGYQQYLSGFPDHRAGVLINGTQVADASWYGYDSLQIEAEVSSELLLPGGNTLEVTALPTNGLYDLFFIDWIEVEYERTFKAVSNQLNVSFSEPGAWKFVFEKFTNSSVDVFDISNPILPVVIENVQVDADSGTYSATFSDNIDQKAAYFAVTEASYLSVQGIEADNPSSLASATNGADYLMISHQTFLVAAASLQSHKTEQGLRSQLIDVQDIYDEFGYGIIDVNAIRNFIAFAYENWAAPAPSFVLLIGDGNFDPKNNLNYGRTSYVPPFLATIDPTIGETAADNRYAAVVGEDTLPDLMLGRLSVNSVAEAQALISKIIAYESNPLEGNWNLRILAVTSSLEPGAHYPHLSESLLQDYFPSTPYHAEKVYWKWTHEDLGAARAAILNEFNNGVFLVNYIGHGAYTYWGERVAPFEKIFGVSDLPALLPQTKLPIILAMTCMEGWYISPRPYSHNYEALGEVITRTAGKGAIASWSPTGWGRVIGHDFLDRGFFKAVYQDGASIIGQATNAGLLNLWATGQDLDQLDTFLLFGDPALQLQISPVKLYLPLIVK